MSVQLIDLLILNMTGTNKEYKLLIDFKVNGKIILIINISKT